MRYAITNTGYLPDSPDRNNDYNIIPSNNITMRGVKFPILAQDDLGNYKVMFPGQDYKFKGSSVKEIPLKQGGQMKEYQKGGKYMPSLNNLPENSQRSSKLDAMLEGVGYAMGAVGDVFSIPQRYGVQMFTGEYSDPSKHIGFKNIPQINTTPTYIPNSYNPLTNPKGSYTPTPATTADMKNVGKHLANFGIDTALDPMNLLGASIAKSFVKGVKSGSIRPRGSAAPTNSFPSFEEVNKRIIDQNAFIKNEKIYKDPVTVVNNNLFQQQLKDRLESTANYMNSHDTQMLRGYKDIYENTRGRDPKTLPDAYKDFPNMTYDQIVEHFGTKKVTPREVLNMSKFDQPTDYNPLYGMKTSEQPISKELYDKMKTYQINPNAPRAAIPEAQKILKEYNFSKNSFIDDMIQRKNMENRYINGLDASGQALNPSFLKQNKDGGEVDNYKDGGIHIDPKNKGKFTAKAKKAGLGVQEYASRVLANKSRYSPATVKQANFARNASKWNKEEGGELEEYQNAGQYFGELTQGMMFDPFQNQDMFGFGFQNNFSPSPVKFDNMFDQNQQRIDQARYPQVERMMTDPSQMVKPLAKDDPFLYKGKNLLNRPRPQADIKLPNTMPGVSDNRLQTTVDPGWGMRRAVLATMGLGIARDLTDNTKSLYDYEMRQKGNSLSKINPSNSFSDYGDYTLNAGLGSNFRPKYQDGGEYDLSQEEIEELMRQGYDVEFL